MSQLCSGRVTKLSRYRYISIYKFNITTTSTASLSETKSLQDAHKAPTLFRDAKGGTCSKLTHLGHTTNCLGVDPWEDNLELRDEWLTATPNTCKEALNSKDWRRKDSFYSLLTEHVGRKTR